ncbi:MAG: PQQ-binding-like beta-propeller repeat protein [Planctomycetota bacterium]
MTMNFRDVRKGLGASVLLSVFAASAAGADVPPGWRGNGVGVFPDATPPTEWGPDKNILWKTPLPKWSNASPILVKDKLFICVEPATLVALSPADGKILWEKPNTWSDILPPDEAETYKTEGEKARIISGKIRQAQDKFDKAARKRKANPGDDSLKQAQDAAKAELAKLREELAPVETYMLPPSHDVNGYSSPTPTSDGKFVYVLFGTGTAACYDLDGNRKWARIIERTKEGYGHCSSPLLLGGKLIVHIMNVSALDPQTGKTLWETPSGPRFGSPVPARAGDTDVIVTANGDFLRASDGKMLAKKLCPLTYNAPVVAGGVAYFIQHGGQAFRLPAKAEEPFTPEKLWQTKPENDRYYDSPVHHDGLLYAMTQTGILSAIDAKTGEVVYKQNLGLGKGTGYPSPVLAGKSLFVSFDNGTTVVVEPGRQFKEVIRNTLPEGFRSTPLFAGSRIYIRGLKHLYCIGK